MDIYLQKSGQKHGPLSEDQIRRGIDASVISSNDLACTSGDESWRPLSTILKLSSAQQLPVQNPASITPSAAPVAPRKWRVDKVGVVFAVIFFSITIGFKLYDSHQREKFQEESKTLPYLREPSTSLSWDANGKPVWTDYKPMARPTPNAFVPTPSPTIETPHVGLLKIESVFVAVYGKSRGSWAESSNKFPGAETVCFSNAEMVYFVLFWHGIAHNLYINRTDGKRLTDENIRTALETYADGGTWKSFASTEERVHEHWERDGAVAELIEYRGDAADVKASRPADVLEIATREYWDEMNRSN